MWDGVFSRPGNGWPITTDMRLAHCSLLTAHCSLLTAHCSLLTAHCSLLTAHCLLHATRSARINLQNACHQSPLLIRYLLCSGLSAKFVSKERQNIGLVRNLLIERTPD